MSEIEPVPCMGCRDPIYPGQELCNDCLQQMACEEANRELEQQAENERWIEENGPEGHGW